MIDFHTHSLLSDGQLLPTELVQRARVKGYRALAITDHADESNIDFIIERLTKVCKQLRKEQWFKVVPGVELTHIPPRLIPSMVKKARALGARVVVGHGETLTEPVAQGTNMAYISSGVDIVSHPGLISDEECRLAAKNSVFLEITSRSGHSLSNGHVAGCARKHRARLILNTDSHAPGDLITDEMALNIALGAGLNTTEFRRMEKNAEELLKQVYR